MDGLGVKDETGIATIVFRGGVNAPDHNSHLAGREGLADGDFHGQVLDIARSFRVVVSGLRQLSVSSGLAFDRVAVAIAFGRRELAVGNPEISQRRAE